jgi:hypothetical protein
MQATTETLMCFHGSTVISYVDRTPKYWIENGRFQALNTEKPE